MIGAVIGDLAAWTWEHDRDCFYERLVSPDAKLSGYGLLPITMWPMINEGGLIHENRLYVKCGKALSHSSGINIPDDWHIWGQSDYDKPISFGLKIALIMSAVIDSGYLSKKQQSELNWCSFFHGGKHEYYASMMMTILRRLNEGATKDESVVGIPEPVFNYYPSGKEHSWHDLLEYITFAWHCFYYSWDFTSGLHNAAKCPANRHLAMMLTGAFAEAMYGCFFSMTKQKFGGNYEMIDFPKSLPNSMSEELYRIRRYERKNRVFFKKNNALTNVERHIWTNVVNPLESYPVNDELYRRLLKAYDTSWEQRYGVYLDNGWFYIYRSHFLLYRFQLTKPDAAGVRKVINFQKSNDPHGEIECVYSVWNALESRWYNNKLNYPYPTSDEPGPEMINNCKYFRGETQCPKKFESETAAKFWHGEKMFVESNQNIESWIKQGEEVRAALSNDKRPIAAKYSPESFGIIVYIETLFRKWCPYDDMDWIFDY